MVVGLFVVKVNRDTYQGSSKNALGSKVRSAKEPGFTRIYMVQHHLYDRTQKNKRKRNEGIRVSERERKIMSKNEQAMFSVLLWFNGCGQVFSSGGRDERSLHIGQWRR